MDALTKHWIGNDLEQLRETGDASADSLVRAVLRDEQIDTHDAGGVFAALTGRTPPDKIAKFLDFADDVGEADRAELEKRIDVEKVRHAQRFFETYGLQIASGLLLQSLPEAYACARGAQVLYLTGELVSDPGRRVRETAQFLVWIFGPDRKIDEHDRQTITTLHAGQTGARAARRVRIFHAIVRHLVTTHPNLADRWKTRQRQFDSGSGPRLGVPVNQEDQLGTMFTFTVSVFEALESMGVEVDDVDRDSWFHVWDIASRHLGLGVESAFSQFAPFRSNVKRTTESNLLGLTFTPEVSTELMALIRERHRAPSHEGKILANALLHEVQDPLPRVLKPMPASFLRYLAGEDVQEVLGVRGGGWLQYWVNRVDATRRVGRVVTSRAPRTTGGELAATIGREVLQQFTQQGRLDPFNQGPQPEFAIPDNLARTWGVRCGSNAATRLGARPAR